jgi:hypothetical protein
MDSNGSTSKERKSTYTKWAILGPIAIVATSGLSAMTYKDYSSEFAGWSAIISFGLGCTFASVLAFGCCLAALYREEKAAYFSLIPGVPGFLFLVWVITATRHIW